MSDEKDGGSAFPNQPRGSDGLPCCEAAPGMSVRDWFAGQALAGLCANDRYSREATAELAYAYADAMLAARKESKP